MDWFDSSNTESWFLLMFLEATLCALLSRTMGIAWTSELRRGVNATPHLMYPKQADHSDAQRKNNNSALSKFIQRYVLPYKQCPVMRWDCWSENLDYNQTLPINSLSLVISGFHITKMKGLNKRIFHYLKSFCARWVHLRKNVALLWHPDYFD